MKITLTNEKKSIDIEIKETAVVIQVTAVGDEMIIRVEEQPMMAIEAQPQEETCKWTACKEMFFAINPHDRMPCHIRHVRNCPTCGKPIEVIN